MKRTTPSTRRGDGPGVVGTKAHAGSREGRGVAPPPPRGRTPTPRRPRAPGAPRPRWPPILLLPAQRSQRERPAHAGRRRGHRGRCLRAHGRRRSRPRGPRRRHLLPRRVPHVRGDGHVLHRVRVRGARRGILLR